MKIKSMSRTDPNKRGGALYEASRNLTEYNQQLRSRGASGNIPASTSPTVSVPKAGTAPAGTRIQSDYEAAQRSNARRNYEYRQTTGQLPSQSGENQELSHRRDVVRDRQANYLQNGGTIGSAQNQVFQRSIDAIDAEIARRQNDRQKEARTRAKNTADALKYNQKTFEKRAKEAKKQYGDDSDEYRAAQQRADEATKAVWEAGLPWQMRVANYADAVGGRLVGTAPQLAATLTRPPENEIRDNELSRRYQAMNNWLQSAADYFYDVSAQGNAALKYGLGKVGSTVADVAVTGGEMLSDAAMNMILPGSGMVAMGLRAGASGANEAYHAGATPGQEFMYGAATAGVEMLTEKMFDGMAKVYGAGAADEITEGIVRRLAETNGGRTLARMLINTPGEGIEEVVSDLANPFIKYIYDNGAALQESYGTGEGFKSMMQEAGYDFLVGAILGVGGAAASVTNGESAAKNARLALQDDFVAQMSTGDGSSFFIEPHSGQTTRFGVEQYGDTWWGYAIDGQGKTYWQNGYKSRSAAERGTAVAASDWIVEQAATPENRANDADVRARDEQRAETAAENPGSTIADDQAVEIQKTLQDSGAKNSSLAHAAKLSGIVDKILNGDTSLSNSEIRALDLYHNNGLLRIVEEKTGEHIDTASNKRIVADVRTIVERRAELYAVADEQKTAQAATATQSISQAAAEAENPFQEGVFTEDVQALPEETENAVEDVTAPEEGNGATSAEPTIMLNNGRTINRQQFIEDIVQARNNAERATASDSFDKLYAKQQQAAERQAAAPSRSQQQAEGGNAAPRTAQNPGLIRDEYTKSQEQKQMNVIDIVAKRLGVTVRFVDNVRGGTANAQVSGNVIEIAKNNRNPVLFLFGHEITHYIQEVSPKSYQAFRDAAMRDTPNAEEIIQRKIRNYAAQGEPLDRQAAIDELAADYAGRMVDDTSVLERFIERYREDRTLLRRLTDAFRSLIDRVGGRYRVNARNAVNLLEKALRDSANAMEKAERQEARAQKKAERQAQKKENAANEGSEDGTRFSIKTDQNGKKYVVVDRQQGRFIGLNISEAKKLAKEIILEEFSGQTLPLGEYAATTVYKQNSWKRRAPGDRYDGANKYIYDGTLYNDDVFLAKMRASANLDELLEAAEYVGHSRDTKNHSFATDGFDYYKTTFVVGNRAFEGTFNIGLSDMGATFYGMTKIEQATVPSTIDLTPVVKSQPNHGDLSGDSIRKNRRDVNRKFVPRDEKHSDESSGSRYSFGLLRDEETRHKAERMEAEGRTPEEIWQSLGVARTMDGRGWRYEIDDSGMEFRRDGDARLMQEPGYRRLQALTDKWEKSVRDGTSLSASEEAEMERLSAEYSDMVWDEKYMLSDFLRHDELFEAYPQLRHVSLRFDALTDGTKGYFSKRDNTIVLSDALFGSDADTLIHEIQHIIQAADGMPIGSNPEYWNRRMEEGYSRRKNDGRIERADKEYRRIFDNAPEAFKNKVREINRNRLAGDYDAAEAIVDEMYDSEYAELWSQLDMADFERRSERGDELLPSDLYRNTAGEIEARDAADRRNLTASERRSRMPKMADENTVFAEGSDNFSIGEITDEAGRRYGRGVHLDSTLLENLTDSERVQMVKERVKELGGQHFTAYDSDGNEVDIQIAKPNARFVNKSGKSVPVNKDLTTKNRNSKVKQEAVVLADELITTASHRKDRAARYPHGWLDDNGKNDWAEWKTYIQDKENTVWEATLHIATSANGEKILYDIDPIKKTGQSGNSDTSTVASIVREKDKNVKPKFSIKEDNQGRKLTEAQQAYFKDSKVRDEDGRLIPVYHATYADDFTVFDRGRLGENTDGNAMDENWAATSHIGFWFNTENLSIKSGLGSRAESVYLNITDPFSAYSIEALAARMGQYEGTPADRGEAFADWLRGEGYDGIVVQDEEFGGTSYVALDPEQIKRVTNQNPTDNPDIRYHIGGVDTEAPDAIESSVQRALALRDSDATPSEIFNQTGLVSLPDGRLRDGMSGNIVLEADDERRRKEGQDGSGGAVQRGKTSGGASETRSVGAAKQSQTRAQTRDRGVDQRQNRQDRSAGKAGTRNWKQLKNAEKAAFRSAVEEYLEETGADVADTLDLVWGNGSGDVDLAIDTFAQDLYSRIGESDLVLENELIAPLGRGNATSLIRKFRSIADEQKSGNVQYSMPAEKRTPSKPRTAYSFAKEVTADYASDFDKHTVAKSVRDIGVLLKDGDERTAAERAHSMAQAVVSTAAVVVNDEDAATRRSLRDYLKGAKLRISDELARGVDGIEALRSGPLAFLTSRTSGLPVDVAYMEMQASFGAHLFPEELVNPADQLQRIADVLEQLRPRYENPFGRTQREQEQAVMELAGKLLDAAKQLPRADLQKANAFVRMTETREFQEFKQQYDETYGEGATDAAIRSIRAYERAMQREADRRRNAVNADRTKQENARILARTRAKLVETRRKAELSALIADEATRSARRDARELISWSANYVQQAEAAAERAEQKRVRQLSKQSEHAELMKRRAVLRAKFQASKTLMSANIKAEQSLERQKRKTEEAQILARRSAHDAMTILERGRRKTDEALKPAPVDTLRGILPEKTKEERRGETLEKAKKIWRGVRTAFESDTLAIEDLSTLQVKSGAEGLTAYEAAKIAKACNSTVEMAFHNGLYDTEGNRIAEPLKEVALCWKAENGVRVVDNERQEILQDYKLHLHNIDRMSERDRAWDKVREIEEQHPWLNKASKRELVLIADGSGPRQAIVVEWLRALKNAQTAKNKPIFADEDGNPVTAEASREIVARYEAEYPDIVEKSRQLDEWWDTFMRAYVVGTSLSLEAYEAMREKYPHYVPTYRVNKGQRGRGVYAGGGTVSTGSFVKKATGSLKEVRYIEDSYADLVARAIRQNRFNAMCANIVETAMNDGDGTFDGFAVFDWTGQENTQAHIDWLTERDGLDGSAKHEPPALEKDGGACRVSCWVDGERVSAYISEELYDALQAVAGTRGGSAVEKGINVFTRIGNYATAPMKTLITGINPLFGIRNLLRDLPTAVVNSHAGGRMLKYLPKAVVMSKTNSAEWQTYCALGGTSQSYYRNENGRLQGNAIANWDTRSSFTAWGKIKSGAKKVGEAVGWFNDLTENAVRFAEYLCAIDNLPGGDTYENRVRGIYYAGEVSVDFSRHGSLGRTINAWIPYWNPAMQGISKVFRSCMLDVTRKHSGFKQMGVTVARAALTMAMPEAIWALIRLASHREDEWEQLSDYVKDNFYCIPLPGKNNRYKFLKIPKNREWAALLANPLWRIVAGIEGRADPFANYWDDSIKANFIPPAAWEAIVVDQLLSLKHNEDFAGRPIVGNQFKDYTTGEYASKKLQYDGDTWAIAKLLSDAMANACSPVQIEYILHSYCGDIGDLIFGLVDMDTWHAITGNAPENYNGWRDLYDLVTAGPRKFVADARYSNAATSRYYDMMDELGQQVADAKAIDPEAYSESEAYQVRSAIQNSYGKRVQSINKQIRETADGPEKDELKMLLSTVAQEALDFYAAAQAGEITQPKQYTAYEKAGVSASVRDELLTLDAYTEEYSFDPSEFSPSKTISARSNREWQLDEEQKQQWREIFADTYNDMAEALIGSARYINATGEKRAELLEGVYEDAKKEAKEAVVDWMRENGYKPVKKEK